jgi:hypothetical protein
MHVAYSWSDYAAAIARKWQFVIPYGSHRFRGLLCQHNAHLHSMD